MDDTRSEHDQTRSTAGFLLAGLGLMLVVLSLLQPWLNIPLLHGWSAFDIPIALGWGLQSSAISYGMAGLLLAVLLAIVLFADGPLPGLRWYSDARPHLLSSRLLLRMGLLTLAIPLLFLFQFVLADFSLVTTVQEQENQAVLVRRHVSHTLPRQHLAVRSFHIDTADPGDRWRLLIMTGGPGLLIPLGAAAALLYGSFLLRSPSPRLRGEGRGEGLRYLALAGGIAGVIILARAPVALAFNYAAQAALQAGDTQGAVSDANIATAINPSIDLLPTVHLTAGEALYRQGHDTGRDVGLFLAAHDRAIGLYTLAWNQDVNLLQANPGDRVARQDTAVTLEMLSESHAPVKLTPADQDTARKNSLTPLQIKVIDGALPWLNRLIHLEADNEYAHYLRGRILFTAHDYAQASQDFTATLLLTTDGNMRSESYTYLAFCRGGLQDLVGQRTLLQIAAKLDTGYYNAIAHQNLSGLH